MTPQEAASMYGDFSLLWEMYFPKTISKNVESTVVAVTFFEDIPF